MDGKRKADEHVCGGKKPRVGFTGDLKVFNGVLSKPEEVDLPDKNTYHIISYSTYLPNWTCQEALRELLSNAIDQSRAVADKFGIFGDLKIREDPDRLALHIGSHLLAEVKWKFGKHGYRHSYYDSTLPGATKRKCKWDKIKNAVTMCVDVINYTSHLTWESFQLGKTTKRGSKNMIGTHGEGLSGAAIVLNRLRCDFVVHCDNYSGRVVNLADRVYILPTNPEKRRKDDVVYKNAVHFRIVLPPPGNLFDVSKLIAPIRLSETVPRVVAHRGQLLTSLELKGKQYNRGIYVAESSKYLFGYNFLDPDKNLLQSRDRNLHALEAAQRECGSILSEAILQSEEVCQRVLECLVYTTQHAAGAASTLSDCVDLADGQYLTQAAQQHLRTQQAKLRGEQEALFCGGDTDLIVRVSGALNLPVVYCHPVLHNHAKVTNDFFQQLKDTAMDLPAESRCSAHQEDICKLMRVDHLRASSLNMSTKLVGFWRVEKVGYVTGLHNLQSDERLSQENEVNIHETLRACKVDLRGIIQIVRCLQSEAQRDRANMRCDPALLDELKAEMEEKLRQEWEERAVREREEAAAAAAVVAAAAHEAEAQQAAAAQLAAAAATQVAAAALAAAALAERADPLSGVVDNAVREGQDGSSVPAVSVDSASVVSSGSVNEDAEGGDVSNDESSDEGTASSGEDDGEEESVGMDVSDGDDYSGSGSDDEDDSSSDYEPSVTSCGGVKAALLAEQTTQTGEQLRRERDARVAREKEAAAAVSWTAAIAGAEAQKAVGVAQTAEAAVQVVSAASVPAVALSNGPSVASTAVDSTVASGGFAERVTGTAVVALPTAGPATATDAPDAVAPRAAVATTDASSSRPVLAAVTALSGPVASAVAPVTAALSKGASAKVASTVELPAVPGAGSTNALLPQASVASATAAVAVLSDAPVVAARTVTDVVVDATHAPTDSADAVVHSCAGHVPENAAPSSAAEASARMGNAVSPGARTASSSAASTSQENSPDVQPVAAQLTVLEPVMVDLVGEDSDQDVEVVTVTSRARRRTSRSPIVFLSPPQTPRSAPSYAQANPSVPVRVVPARRAESTCILTTMGVQALDASGQTSPALTDTSDACSEAAGDAVARAAPVSSIFLPMPSAAGGLGGGTLHLTYCATALSGAWLYDSLDDVTTLQKHCEQLHQHKDMTALLTKLCTHYSFQVVLFRAAQASPPLAFRLWQKVLFVNVTDGGSEAGERAAEDLRAVLRSITLLDALLM
jgi:hypothetical protein